MSQETRNFWPDFVKSRVPPQGTVLHKAQPFPVWGRVTGPVEDPPLESVL